MTTRDHGLRRELKLRDLVFMQILLVVGLEFSGYAAKQGPSQGILWLLAIGLFYIPLSSVVMKLSRAIPVEGGVYQWVKTGISPFAGYMAAWGLTVWAIAYFASVGSQLATGMGYAAGQDNAWMATSKAFALSITVLVCLLAFTLNVFGLHVTKWLSSAGSLLKIATFLTLLFLLVLGWLSVRNAQPRSLAFVWPGFSILTLNVFTKMALFALSGLDQCSIFAEECRKPKNDVARSVLIAAPLIAGMYMLTTSSILAYIAPANVNVAAPLAQSIQAGFGSSGAGRALTAIAVGGFSLGLAATVVIVVGMIARLPMVAGWDGVLPPWWSSLHPRFRTPTKAIGAVTASLLFLGALSLFGSGNQEAVQVLSAVGFGSYCFMYLLVFGMVASGFRATPWRPSILMRVGAFAAFLVVLVSLAFELVPVGEVANPALFATKVILAICASNGIGAFLYWRGSRQSHKLASAA
jgi:amino acid transporter